MLSARKRSIWNSFPLCKECIRIQVTLPYSPALLTHRWTPVASSKVESKPRVNVLRLELGAGSARDWRAISGAECGRTAGIRFAQGTKIARVIELLQRDRVAAISSSNLAPLRPCLFCGRVGLGLSNPDRLHACSPDRRPAGMRPYTRKTKCDHIFPSAAALAVTCDHIFPERRHRRRDCNHISFATGATPGAEVRSRRRNVAQSVLPSVRLVRNRPQAREGTPRITRARTLGASAVRVDAPPSRRSVRLPIAEKLKEPQRTPKGAAPRPFGATEAEIEQAYADYRAGRFGPI